MIGSWVSCALLASAPIATVHETVGVLPIRGDSGPLSRNLVERLRGIEGITVVSAIDLRGLLGPEVAARVAACESDTCVAQAVTSLRTDKLVLGEISGARVRLRLVDTSTPSAAIVRVSVDLGETLATSIELASALFEGKRGFGLLVVETSPVAFVSIDGEPRGPAPVGPLSLAVGRHTVVVDAPEYDSEERELEVRLGDTTRLEVSLSKPVGSLPFVLGGSGVAAVGGGAVAAIIASSIASDWKAACATGHCDPGYSREVYSSDEGRVLALNGVSVALIAVGAALVLAGGGAWLAR